MYQPPGGHPPHGYLPPQGYPQWHGPMPQPPRAPYGPPPRNRRRLVVVLVTMLVVGVVGFLTLVGYAYSLLDDPATDEERLENAVDAQFVTEFSTVCDRGSVSNAGAFEEPYTIVAFRQKDMDDDLYSEVTFDHDSDYDSADRGVATTNVVACLSQKEGTEKRAGTCEYDASSSRRDDIGHYSVQYEVELREARTGTLIENLGVVDGPADECPGLVYITGSRIYAGPDQSALEAKLDAFLGR